MLEGQLPGIDVGTKELVGRLENGTRRELGRVVAVREIICRGIWGKCTARRGVMRRLLVELLLHCSLLDVVGEFGWRHSEINNKRL